MNELNNYLEEETIVSLFKNPEQEVLNVIISAGKNLNEVIVVRTEQTLLHCAVEHQYEMVAATLLGYGMNGLTKDKSGETALGLAIKRKKSDSMSALIARSMKPLELRILFGLLWEEDENKDQVEKELDLNEDLLNSNCYFTETIRVVFDSLKKPVKDYGWYDIKPLIEDDKGRMPDASDFNYRHRTGFQNIAEKGFKEVVSHPIVQLVINYKWKSWARKKFAWNFVLHILSVILLTVTVALAGTASDVKAYDTSLQRARLFFEVVVGCFVIKAFVLEIIQAVRNGCRYYSKHLLNSLELYSALALLIVIPVRYIDTKAHWYIFAFGYLLWVIKLFKYMVAFSQTGTYAESLLAIFWKDIIPFSVLFGIVNLAFGGTFFLVMKGDGSLQTHDDTSSLWGIWYVGLRTMIEAQTIVEYTGSEGYRPVGTILMLVFMFITIVVLLNILIAQISDTYKTIQTDAKKSMLVNRSWTIARLERNALLFPNKNQNCLRNLRERLKKLLPSYKTGPQEGVARSHQEEGQNKCERFLSEADLKTLPSNETEEIRSTLTRIEKQLWKTDQNLKARVRTQTIEVKHINYTLQEIKEMLKPSHSR